MRPARSFLNHTLQVLKDYHMNRHIRLTEDFAKDLNWFNTLCSYNGVTFYDNKVVQATIALDTSLTGLGTIFLNMVYALPLPYNYLGYNITQLEMLNIMVAFQVWGHIWQNMHIEKNVIILLLCKYSKKAKLGTPYWPL